MFKQRISCAVLVVILFTSSHTVFGQAVWQQLTRPDYNDFNSVFFTDSDSGWIVGGTWDNIYFSNTAGDYWDAFVFGDFLKSDVYFVDANLGWVVGSDSFAGIIIRTTDGGLTWELLPDLPGLIDPQAVFFINDSTGWVVGQDSTILKTTNGGDTWNTPASLPPAVTGISAFYDIQFIDENFGWIAGEGPPILLTVDGGDTWLEASSLPDSITMNSISFVDNNTGWAVGWNWNYEGIILNTTDGGDTWIIQDNPDPDKNALNAVFFLDNTSGWAVGDYGTILYTTDGGDTWSAEGIRTFDIGFGFPKVSLAPKNGAGLSEDLNDVFFSDASHGWIAGGYGTVLKYVTDPAAIVDNRSMGSWLHGREMPTGRRAAEAAAVNGKVYVIGGNADFGVTDEVEEYDPVRNIWSVMEPLPSPRKDFGIGVIDGKIYVVGGYDDYDLLSSVEVFDPITNSWSQAASLVEARKSLVVGVADGKLYAVGGQDDYWDASNLVEVYDPAADEWTIIDSMMTARYSHQAIGVNGRVYVIGGYNGNGDYVAGIDVYDPVTGTWSVAAYLPDGVNGFTVSAVNNEIFILSDDIPTVSYNVETDEWTFWHDMPSPREGGMASASLEGKIYVAGGYYESDDLDIFDPFRLSSWSFAEPLITARKALGAEVVNGTIYAVGGVDYDYYPLSTMEYLDPDVGYWQDDLPPFPGDSTRHSVGVATIGSDLYVIGGVDNFGSSVATNWVFDTFNETWTILSPMIYARRGAGVGVIDGKIYVAGGGCGGDGASDYFEVYDPATNTWTELTPMSTMRKSVAAAVLDGKLYIIGGRDNDYYTVATVEFYDPVAGMWSLKADLNTPRRGADAAVLGGKIYVVGGDSDEDYLSSVEEYDPATDTWSYGDPMSVRRKGLAVVADDNFLYAIGGDDYGGDSPTDAVEIFDPSVGFLIVSIPEEITGQPGDTVSVPVMLEADLAGLGAAAVSELELLSFELFLNGGFDILTIDSINSTQSILPSGEIQYNILPDGTIKIAWASDLEITNTGELFEIAFRIDPEAEMFSTSDLIFSHALFNEGSPPVVAKGGSFAVLLNFGDVNDDDSVTPDDAVLILQHVVHIITLNADSKARADVSGVADVTAFDASLILQKSVGLIETFPIVELFMSKEVSSITNENARIITEMNEPESGVIEYSLEFENIKHVYSLQGKAIYDPSEFEYMIYSLTDLSKDFIIETDAKNGTITWAMAGNKEIKSDGEFITFRFRRKATNASKGIVFTDFMLNEQKLDSKAVVLKGAIVERFELYQNFPNPFNPETVIKYALPERSDVTLKIFNILGQEVRTLVREEKEPGYHTVTWNGKNNNGSFVSSGIYIYQIKAGSFIQRKKMTFIR